MAKTRFAPFIERVSEATGLGSQNQLSKALGIHRSAITQAKRNDSVPDKWIAKLAEKFDLNPSWLRTGTGPKSSPSAPVHETAFRMVPRVKARLCAGSRSFDTSETVEGYCSFQAAWLRSKGNASEMVLMGIFGDSMEPELKEGDTVLIDQSQRDVLAGALFAVGIEDVIMVKRLEKRPGKLILLSENPAYESIVFSAEEMKSVRIIGRVLWVGRELG